MFVSSLRNGNFDLYMLTCNAKSVFLNLTMLIKPTRMTIMTALALESHMMEEVFTKAKHIINCHEFISIMPIVTAKCRQEIRSMKYDFFHSYTLAGQACKLGEVFGH